MTLPWRTPYRWRAAPWINIRFIFSDLCHGIYNCFRWVPVIWFDADYDWEYLAEVMEYKLRRMSKRAGNAKIVTSWRRTERECLICAELLRRLREDGYYERALHNLNSTKIARQIGMAQSENERKYLGKLIGKHMTHWWD